MFAIVLKVQESYVLLYSRHKTAVRVRHCVVSPGKLCVIVDQVQDSFALLFSRFRTAKCNCCRSKTVVYHCAAQDSCHCVVGPGQLSLCSGPKTAVIV